MYGMLATLYIALAGYSFWKKDHALRGILSAVAVLAVTVFILSFNMEDERVVLMLLLLNGAIGIGVGLRYDTLRTIVTGSVVYLFTIPVVLTSIQLNGFGLWIMQFGLFLSGQSVGYFTHYTDLNHQF